MSQKAKAANAQPTLIIEGEVVRRIRQHARSSPQAEICGVLIGQDRGGRVEVQASIAGAKAEEAGAHVTFTQDTWEHIYQVKDNEYPNERIVGWYHSHPGFGVFLSDHDTFIHKNFFASPGQVAWVFDPHSDEEGCFGWVDGSIERLSRITVSDQRGGERVREESTVQARAQTAMVVSEPYARSQHVVRKISDEQDSGTSLVRLATNVFACLTFLLLGFMIAWYLFPRVEVVPIPVDPMTGKPLPGYSLEQPEANPGQQAPAEPNRGGDNRSAPPDSNGAKEELVQPK